MRIVLFHPTLLPPKDYGGVERVVLWLAEGLLERGHSVAVANAHPEVLAAARLRTASNDEDGVAQILEQLLCGTMTC